ncbi:MAG: hypothetical protein JSV84_05380 [Gemmatimonadota bacterium]|nr:MAG: hypothetical protein JSV84_05380 [Gemmatimonadota bacterium]
MENNYSNSHYLKKIFNETEVLKKPIHRVISGYHHLPYILIGTSFDNLSRTTEIRGIIHVSPRMIIRPGEGGQTYGEIFGEENIEPAIVARIFGFLYLRERTTKFACDDLSIQELHIPLPEVADRVMDELARRECIDTGVIRSPDIGVYPVSIDRYIKEMLDKELSTGTIM